MAAIYVGMKTNSSNSQGIELGTGVLVGEEPHEFG